MFCRRLPLAASVVLHRIKSKAQHLRTRFNVSSIILTRREDDCLLLCLGSHWDWSMPSTQWKLPSSSRGNIETEINQMMKITVFLFLILCHSILHSESVCHLHDGTRILYIIQRLYPLLLKWLHPPPSACIGRLYLLC